MVRKTEIPRLRPLEAPFPTPVAASPPGPRLPFGGKGPKALPWKPLPFMEEYLEDLRSDGEHTQAYQDVTKIGLKHFALFCAAEDVKHPEEITRSHLLRFQVYLAEYRKENGEPIAQSYRQQLLKYVRAWINWMEEVEHIERNPWIRIKVGTQKKVPKPLEDDEVAQLFQAHRSQAFAIPPFYYHRREVILVLLLGWGLRIHELQSLNLADLDLRSDWVEARNKGGGRKTVPFSQEMKFVVQRYLTWRGKYAVIGEMALLVDQEGKRLSIQMIRKIITELGLRAGVTINPHRLRDTFGTTMLDNDVEVERIMKMMGHSSKEQTLAYAKVRDHKLKESHDRVINPLLHKLLGGSLP